MHVHVQSESGEAKFWLEPVIALAQNHGLKGSEIFESLRLIGEHEQSIRRAWQAHFGR